MNKKVLILLIVIALCIVCSTFALANSKKDKFTEKPIEKGAININDTYVKLEKNNINEENYIIKSNEHLISLNTKNEKFENPTVEIYKNNMEDRTEIVVTDANKVIKLDKDSGEILSYMHKNTSFKKNTLNEENVKKVAMDLFNSLKNFEDYEFYALEEFDQEVYLAKFCKKYDKYINPGEMICFGFSPEAKEIVNFTKKNIQFANNEIKLSSEEARTIAMNYLNNSVATNMTIKVGIVEPNCGLRPALEGENVYKKANQTRLAYICEFNNADETKIYIDCTTGDVIGADWIAGGEF